MDTSGPDRPASSDHRRSRVAGLLFVIAITASGPAPASRGAIDAEAMLDGWIADGSLQFVGPAGRTETEAPNWDPRRNTTPHPAIDLRRGADGLWRGWAGTLDLATGRAEPTTWEVHRRGGTLELSVAGATNGCWSVGRRTEADFVRLSRDDHGWTASMCGRRMRVVAWPGRGAALDAWERRVLADMFQDDDGTCRLWTSGCDPHRLVARCGDGWRTAKSREDVPAPAPRAASCGTGFLPDAGVEVPDPCSLPAGTASCRAEAGDATPDRAEPYIRWCDTDPEWMGPGLHPPYRAGRPHGAVLACLRRAMQSDPTTCGDFAATVGRPVYPGGPARLLSMSSTLNREFETCVANALREWSPPGPPDGGTVNVRGVLRVPGPEVRDAPRVP